MHRITPDNGHSHEKGGHGGRWIGLFIVLVGLGLLIRKLDQDIVPDWVISWPFALTLLGVIVLFKQKFTGTSPYLMIVIGAFFLMRNYLGFPKEYLPFIWPVLIIIIGLVILFKPGHKGKHHHRYGGPCQTDIKEDVQHSDLLEMTSVFCGTRKKVLSQEFKGGELTAVFGGVELNLSQADIKQEARLDLSIVFGGVKLIVPNNWEVRSQLTTIAAGVEDKRQMDTLNPHPEKVLVLQGEIVFGGIDIQNH